MYYCEITFIPQLISYLLELYETYRKKNMPHPVQYIISLLMDFFIPST